MELVWAVRRVTDIQAKYIAMFYGEDVLAVLQRQEAAPAAVAAECVARSA